ncbi:hypothetical protein NW815_13660, partial [Synechococcus sp. R6-7]
KATITNIKGNEVTFQISGPDIKLTPREPKQAGFLSVEQEVEVKVLGLREDKGLRPPGAMGLRPAGAIREDSRIGKVQLLWAQSKTELSKNLS